MLIQGTVDIQDLNPHHGAGQRRGRPLRSYMLTKKLNECYYLSVKNSMYPNCINYKITDLDRMFTKCLNERKFGLQFKHPSHLLLIVADDLNMLKMFHRQLQDIVDGKYVNIGQRQMPKTLSPKVIVNPFDPRSTQFIGVDHFDRRILNMTHLSKLVLDNCILSSLPEELGHLPITYLSISGCKLPTSSTYDQYIFWNWTSKDTICKSLTTLKMDSIELNKLPFEIIFLSNLDTLSVAKNKLRDIENPLTYSTVANANKLILVCPPKSIHLCSQQLNLSKDSQCQPPLKTYLPHFIGELRKLLYFNVSDNQITYFPDSVISRNFNHLDISNNNFSLSDNDYELPEVPDYIQKYVTLDNKNVGILGHFNNLESYKPSSLSDLSFIRWFKNGVKFKRQDIPRIQWHLYDLIARCVNCSKYSLPDYDISYNISIPGASNLITTHSEIVILWLSFTCSKCLKAFLID